MLINLILGKVSLENNNYYKLLYQRGRALPYMENMVGIAHGRILGG